MKLKNIFLSTAFALCVSAPAHSQQRASVHDFISAFISISSVQCKQAKSANGEPTAAMAPGVEMLCTCAPAQARQLQASLTKAESDRVLTEADFQKQYSPRIVNHCAAQQLRAQFRGDRCTGQPVPPGVNPASYCSCMEGRVAAIPDAEAALLGADMADYEDSVRLAQRNHQPEPAMPQSVTRFSAIHAACARK